MSKDERFINPSWGNLPEKGKGGDVCMKKALVEVKVEGEKEETVREVSAKVYFSVLALIKKMYENGIASKGIKIDIKWEVK